MNTPRPLSFLAALILAGAATLPVVGLVQAQQAQAPADPEELSHRAAQHPSAESLKAAREAADNSPAHVHEEMLRRLYTAEVIDPLTDNFDRTTPGGFKAALARARTAGVPGALLAELEVSRAAFDVNFPDLVAALPRMEAARAHWQVSASIFPSPRDFDAFLSIMHNVVARERAEPGSFAPVALRARKRAIARAVYGDLQTIDGASDMYVIENNVHLGQTVPVEGWLAKIAESHPKSHLVINRGADVTGQPFGPQRFGDLPAVPPVTYRALADAVPDEFWKPYRIPNAPAAHP